MSINALNLDKFALSRAKSGFLNRRVSEMKLGKYSPRLHNKKQKAGPV
jgi:hypothetical protein